MSNYRRAFIPGGTWFFTVNLLQRRANNLLVRKIDLLRRTVRRVRSNYPFHIDAWVVLLWVIDLDWLMGEPNETRKFIKKPNN